MRKYKKQQIITALGSFREAHDEIRNLIEKEEFLELEQMLVTCQQLAIQVGTALEESAGEGLRSVGLLEQYCEMIYQVGNMNDVGQNAAEIRELLNRQIAIVKSEIETEITVRLEVVFLPYKAAMWDSLESIWKAANEDPDCDAYVVPIPYFDKNAEGILEKAHYEGMEFPEEIPVTDFRTYSIKDRQPDIIFIHNPYDATNYVTSIHPEYYSKELKKYTDQLVYIPYFVSANDTVQERLCVLPGTIYADKVVLQSEKVRDKYVEVFKREMKEMGCPELSENAEDKFVALGSPKFDKVLSTKREEIIVPESWNRLMYKESGERKKVVLYNTHMNNLMKGKGERFLKKIRMVLETFEHQQDLVLLWRPHPLSDSTAAALNPQVREQYEAIVKEYREKEYGIFDDSADLHRAIAISDAYYGDKASSLVTLYKLTGKPIMIQNMDILKDII